jgi:hypothetical protein
MKAPDLRAVFNELTPEFDGGNIRHQLTAAGIFQKDFTERAVGPQIAEDIPAGAVEKIGDDPQDFALRPLPCPGGAKQ